MRYFTPGHGFLRQNSVRAWARPEPIWFCENLCSVPMDAKQDNGGVFHIVFAEREGDPFYLQYSEESTDTVAPRQVGVVDSGVTAYLPRLAYSDQDTIHVVWTETELPNGPTLRVNYSYSADAGKNWAIPREIGGRFHSDGNVVVTNDGVVHLVWNGGVGAGGRYHQFSIDGGTTWSPTHTFCSMDGQAGYPSVVQDSSGGLHFVTGQGEYVTYNDGQWSESSKLPFFAADVEHSRLAIVRGNQLIAVSPRIFSGMYYSVMNLPLPTVYVRDLPKVVDETTEASNTEIPTCTPTPIVLVSTPVLAFGSTTPDAQNRSTLPIVLSFITSMFLVVVVLVSRKKILYR